MSGEQEVKKATEAKEATRLSRRGFVKGSALAALAATAGTGALGSLYGCDDEPGDNAANAVKPEEKIVWNMCTRDYGCGAVLCPLQYHIVDGEINYVESDNTGSPEFGEIQARACLRGRTARRFLNHPNRLQYPMKRVGRRGDGEFERISWDEAVEMFAEKLKYTIDTYGNEAVMMTWGGPTNVGPFARLINLMGGHLGAYGSDSCGQIIEGSEYLYSVANGMNTSPLIAAAKADLLVLFGNSPAETAMGGGSACYDLERVREAGTRIISIDQRLNETSSAHPDEWIPIMNGTDAALCSAINYVLITEGMADEDFLHEYCVGYDETNMPEGAPVNSSYKDYIMGTGYDMVAKTPEWASPITRIPVERIYELAREIGEAETVFITQGWGPQRHSNGENSSRAIMMVAIVSGNVGKPGTNTGGRDQRYNYTVPEFSGGIPTGDNPVKATISTVMRFEAIDRGAEMTALHDGVRGRTS
jgi:anaerobic selenocysteine-containing dehydrogenase